MVSGLGWAGFCGGDNVSSKRLVSSLFHSLSLSLTLYPLLIITTDKLLTILLLL